MESFWRVCAQEAKRIIKTHLGGQVKIQQLEVFDKRRKAMCFSTIMRITFD